MFLDDTQRRTTVGRTPLDGWSARRRDLYLKTQLAQQTSVHDSGGIRTHNLRRRAVADLRLRPRGHFCIISYNKTNTIHNTNTIKQYYYLSPHVSAKFGLLEENSLYIVEYTEGQGWPKHVEINVNNVLLYFMLYCMLFWFWCYELFQRPCGIHCWAGHFFTGK